MLKRFGAGFALGYVLGSRAGRDRYEELTDLAERAFKVPGVRSFADRASELVNADNGRRLIDAFRERAGLDGPDQDEDQADDHDDDDQDDRAERGGDGATSSNGQGQRDNHRRGRSTRHRRSRIGALANSAVERGRVS